MLDAQAKRQGDWSPAKPLAEAGAVRPRAAPWYGQCKRGLDCLLAVALLVLALGVYVPPVLREGYGLPWRGLQRSGYRAAVTAVRTLLPVTPQRLRLVPQARHSAA